MLTTKRSFLLILIPSVALLVAACDPFAGSSVSAGTAPQTTCDGVSLQPAPAWSDHYTMCLENAGTTLIVKNTTEPDHHEVFVFWQKGTGDKFSVAGDVFSADPAEMPSEQLAADAANLANNAIGKVARNVVKIFPLFQNFPLVKASRATVAPDQVLTIQAPAGHTLELGQLYVTHDYYASAIDVLDLGLAKQAMLFPFSAEESENIEAAEDIAACVNYGRKMLYQSLHEKVPPDDLWDQIKGSQQCTGALNFLRSGVPGSENGAGEGSSAGGTGKGWKDKVLKITGDVIREAGPDLGRLGTDLLHEE